MEDFPPYFISFFSKSQVWYLFIIFLAFNLSNLFICFYRYDLLWGWKLHLSLSFLCEWAGWAIKACTAMAEAPRAGCKPSCRFWYAGLVHCFLGSLLLCVWFPPWPRCYLRESFFTSPILSIFRKYLFPTLLYCGQDCGLWKILSNKFLFFDIFTASDHMTRSQRCLTDLRPNGTFSHWWNDECLW